MHILDAIDTILDRTAGITFEDLVADKIFFGGIVFYIMIIGEAAYKLSKVFKDTYTDTNWQAIANMRHHIVHGYYQVNPTDVWDVIQNDLQPLRAQVEKLLSDIDWDEWEQTNLDL